MNGKASKPGGIAESVRAIEEVTHRQGQIIKSWASILAGTAAGVLALVYLTSTVLSARVKGPKPSPGIQETVKPAPAQPEVIVYASDLPKSALSEFDSWNDPASPGGRMVGTPNSGEELDPPPRTTRM